MKQNHCIVPSNPCSASQTFLCCGPATSSAEAARLFVIKFHFKNIDVGGGLNTTSQLQTHFSFILIQDLVTGPRKSNVILHTKQCLFIHNSILKPAKINVSKVPAFG